MKMKNLAKLCLLWIFLMSLVLVVSRRFNHLLPDLQLKS